MEYDDLVDKVVNERQEDAINKVASEFLLTVKQVKWRLRDNTGRWENDAWYDRYFEILNEYVQEAAK